MILFSLTTDSGIVNIGSRSGANVSRFFQQFAKAAKEILVEKIQEVIGSDTIYPLSDNYKDRKQFLKGYKHVEGKSIEQPLIFSREHIYDNITGELTPTGVVVYINPANAYTEDGFDIAQYWEDKAHYLEVAHILAEPLILDKFNELLEEFLRLN